jgi:hypothetical protein
MSLRKRQEIRSCCRKRKFKWVRDKNGRVGKSVPLNDQTIDALKHARAEFEITFGRPPRKADPVFTGRYYISVADMRREILRAMRKAGISPALQYAYRKTDFLVMDPKLPSAKELDEYERAIDEFYTAADSGIPLSELIDPETPEQFMHEQLQRIQVIGGYFIGKHFNRFRSRKTENPNVEVKFIVGFAMTNFGYV